MSSCSRVYTQEFCVSVMDEFSETSHMRPKCPRGQTSKIRRSFGTLINLPFSRYFVQSPTSLQYQSLFQTLIGKVQGFAAPYVQLTRPVFACFSVFGATTQHHRGSVISDRQAQKTQSRFSLVFELFHTWLLHHREFPHIVFCITLEVKFDHPESRSAASNQTGRKT